MVQSKQKPVRTIFDFLFHSSWRLCVLSISMTALVLISVNLATLRDQVSHHLNLIGRTISYSTEAAIVFKNSEAATEVIQKIIEAEEVAKATIYLNDESVFAHLEKSNENFIVNYLPKNLFHTYVDIPVVVNGFQIAHVVIENDGRQIVQYSCIVLGTGFFSVLLLLGIARYLANKNAQRIKNKLNILTDATQRVINHQDFSIRVPPMHNIMEFHQLGQDFNELFRQLEIFHENQRQQHENLAIKNKALNQQAIQDSLTQLYNRRGFEQAMIEQIENARTRNQKIGVLYLDNDKFKRINDEYGHAVGDALLIDVARRIRSVTRETDFIARLGGDEFSVLLPRVRTPQDALRVAQKIIDAMASPLIIENSDIEITPGVSIGIAIYPEHGDNYEALLKAADHAMYLAKQNGRGHWRLFSAETDPSFTETIKAQDAIEPTLNSEPRNSI